MAVTNSRACATSSARHSLLVAGVLPSEAQVVRHGAAEQVRLLGDHGDPCPEVVSRLVAHIEAVDEHGAARYVEHARDEAQKRRLARARAADHRRGLARLEGEGQTVQHRLLAPGIAEDDVAELDDPVQHRRPLRHRRVDDGGLGAEHLFDPLRAGDGPGPEDDHHHGDHHGNEDLHDVAEKSGQVADRHAPVRDEVPAEPDHGDAREVHQAEDGRQRQGEHAVDAKAGIGQRGVGVGEALALDRPCG